MRKRIISFTAMTLLALSAPVFADKVPSRLKVKINIAALQEMDEARVEVRHTLTKRIVGGRENNNTLS
ncbi:hypothetical protein [Endozoicomonas sp. 8E]|uniref:hypothetical protein n=1 Tax=Endozoicomonas sp. 8E TaxID=3035692 RepID=UPI002938FE64|nr:hypothetical protein [Endozoicomonas sp. 8E]WOG30198.1 hypothetical protein P6910_11285 [Endozoicomonas sp. 8E]